MLRNHNHLPSNLSQNTAPQHVPPMLTAQEQLSLHCTISGTLGLLPITVFSLHHEPQPRVPPKKSPRERREEQEAHF